MQIRENPSEPTLPKKHRTPASVPCSRPGYGNPSHSPNTQRLTDGRTQQMYLDPFREEPSTDEFAQRGFLNHPTFEPPRGPCSRSWPSPPGSWRVRRQPVLPPSILTPLPLAKVVASTMLCGAVNQGGCEFRRTGSGLRYCSNTVLLTRRPSLEGHLWVQVDAGSWHAMRRGDRSVGQSS